MSMSCFYTISTFIVTTIIHIWGLGGLGLRIARFVGLDEDRQRQQSHFYMLHLSTSTPGLDPPNISNTVEVDEVP